MRGIIQNVSQVSCLLWPIFHTRHGIPHHILLSYYFKHHCATSRKVAGSIPDYVIGIFHWFNPSVRTMTLSSTQPLIQMRTRNISWRGGGEGDQFIGLTTFNLTTIMCLLSRNMEIWKPQTPGTLWACNNLIQGLLYLYYFKHKVLSKRLPSLHFNQYLIK
jgi:hypothetical protein